MKQNYFIRRFLGMTEYVELGALLLGIFGFAIVMVVRNLWRDYKMAKRYYEHSESGKWNWD